MRDLLNGLVPEHPRYGRGPGIWVLVASLALVLVAGHALLALQPAPVFSAQQQEATR